MRSFWGLTTAPLLLVPVSLLMLLCCCLACMSLSHAQDSLLGTLPLNKGGQTTECVKSPFKQRYSELKDILCSECDRYYSQYYYVWKAPPSPYPNEINSIHGLRSCYCNSTVMDSRTCSPPMNCIPMDIGKERVVA